LWDGNRVIISPNLWQAFDNDLAKQWFVRQPNGVEPAQSLSPDGGA
jgi:hypothetical protein